MRIEFETNDKFLLGRIFQKKENDVVIGDKIELNTGISIVLKNASFQRSADASVIIEILVEYAKPVTISVLTSLLAAWLYDKLKNNSSSLKIEDKQTNIDKENIKKAILERLKEK